MKGLRASAAALACALVVGPAAAATADTWTHTDASGDVRTENTSSHTWTPDPGNTNSDITSFRVAHNRTTLGIRLRTRSATPKHRSAAITAIRTPQRKYLLLVGSIVGGTTLSIAGGKTVRCRGIKYTVDGSRSLLQMTVPRSCIGDPRWVKVGTELAVLGDVLHQDDANSTGQPKMPTLGPKVFAPKG